MANSPNKTFDSLVNLLDRFDKRRKNHDQVSPSTLTASPTTPDSPSSGNTSASSSFSSSNIFNNLNFSFHNKGAIEDHQNSKQQAHDPKSSSDINLVVIDDDEYDDPSDAFDPFKTTRSDDTCETREKSVCSAEIAPSKMTASSSFYKHGSHVFDDMARNNPTLSNVVDEAESLRQRFIGKKKALDTTFDNFSIKRKGKQFPSSLESSLKVPNSGLKTTQSDIDIQVIISTSFSISFFCNFSE